MKLLLFMSFMSLWRGSDETGADPVIVKEGDDVMLPCSFSSSSIRHELFDWEKDKKDVFKYHSGDINPSHQGETFRGRVSHFPEQLDVGNASIVIRDTKVTDSGTYTCAFPLLQPARESNIVLVVGAAQEPSVTILNETKDWALLRCAVRGASPKPKVYWEDGDKNLVPAEEPQVSERGGRYNIILQTTVTKTDHYRCVSTQEEIKHQTHAEIFVHLNGAATKPSVTILDETTDRALLQCEVHGASPKPVVQWQNRAGDIVPAGEPQVSERGGRYDIILQTTVTKTDLYRCVSTQEEIKHQTHAEIHIYIGGAAPEPVVKTLGETKDGVQLQCAVRGASPKPKVYWQDGDKNLVPAEEPQVSERGGRYDIILQTTVTKTDHYRCVSTQEEIHHEIYTETFVPVHDTRGTLPVAAGVPVWAVVGLVVGVAVLALLVGVVVGVVVHKRKTAPKSSSDRPDSSEGTSLNRDVC